MKGVITALFGFLIFQINDTHSLVGSVWACNVTATCVNTLMFKSNGTVLEYNCELDYAFHSTYKLTNDTIIIKGKDDSHSEDNGKVDSYWVSTYVIRGSGLYMIKNKVSFRGKWEVYTNKNNKVPEYKKIR